MLNRNTIRGIFSNSNNKLNNNYNNKYFTTNNKYFKDFHELDKISQEKADFLIESMDQMMKFPSILQIKELAINQLCNKLSKKNPVILADVGCGCGYDTVKIANQSNQIRAIGIDNSHRMINIAKKNVHPRVQYRVGDINDMVEYRSYFDACYADRLLVSSTNPNNLFDNLIQLIKPKGIISITDVDALSIILYPYNEITQMVLEKLQQGFVNPYMGRKLPELFTHSSIDKFEVTPSISMVRDFHDLCKIFNFCEIIDSIVVEGKITIKDRNKWLESMSVATKEGKFMYSVSFYTVQGYMK